MTSKSKRAVAYGLWLSAKRRAEAQGLPFNIERTDIVVPEFCPILGIELRPGAGKVEDHSPTLDRIIPSKGYVKGNVVVISMRANRLKSNANVDELRRIASFYDQIIQENNADNGSGGY